MSSAIRLPQYGDGFNGIFCSKYTHQSSPVPIEETVRAFNHIIDKGWVRPINLHLRVFHSVGLMSTLCRRLGHRQAMYWATSEWSARDIEEAHRTSHTLRALVVLAYRGREQM